MPPRQRPTTPAVVGDGDPSGIEILTPGHPGFPSAYQLSQLKGAPGPQDVRELTPEETKRYQDEGYLLGADELREATPVVPPAFYGLRLLEKNPVHTGRHLSAETKKKISDALKKNHPANSLTSAKGPLPKKSPGTVRLFNGEHVKAGDTLFNYHGAEVKIHGVGPTHAVVTKVKGVFGLWHGPEGTPHRVPNSTLSSFQHGLRKQHDVSGASNSLYHPEVNPRSPHSALLDHYNKWGASLGQKEAEAVHAYGTLQTARTLNKNLRAGKTSSKLVPHLDSALAKGRAPADFDVVRSVTLDPSQLSKLKAGATHTDPGYSSTAVGKNAVIGGSAVFHIRVPKGSDGALIPSVARHGIDEFVLPRNSRLQIHSTEQRGAQLHVHATYTGTTT